MKTDTDKYYKFLRHVNRTICLYCQKTLSGTTTSNIRRHYKIVHSIEIPRKKETQSKTKEECVETPVKERKTQEGICIDIDKSKFLRCCVGLVAAKNLPFGIYDDEEFFKILIAPYEKKFNTNLNSKNIVSLIENSSVKIQQIIRERIKNKMICLDFDVVKIMDYKMLVIDVHYIQDFQICINTIGVIMLDRKQQDQTIYLKEEIIKCLQSYQIDINQIYASKSNCGCLPQISTMIHTVKEEKICDEFIEEKCNYVENIDEDIHSILSTVLSVGESIAHTIQLAVNDVLKNLEIEIQKCRNIVIQLRKTFEESDSQVQIPNLDNLQNWYSTYEMLFSFIQSRQTIETWHIQKDIIIDINWDFITDFVVAFNPLVTCRKKMQSEQYIIGDFYRDWLCCEIELEDLFSVTPYASILHESMQKRKEKVFLDDVTFLAALYLDPRFNFENSIVLSEEQKSTAIENLLKTFTNLKKLEASQPEDCKMKSNSSNTSSFVSCDLASTSFGSTYSKLEQRMMQSMMSINKANTHLTFKQKITSLSNQKKVPLDADILNFWVTTRLDNDIKKVASIALAVPITHVSIEKAFKALSTILPKLESTVDNDTLNSLLLTNLNFVELYLNNTQIDFADQNILVLNEADID
ncbi:uncharacterized protein LOC119684835 [Teleopsis dalmanni]|uniref:uncharacterized protein LOC119684835 n=1 Tax=Teleopsis dalmanni TaxID=139649 RepID=UPI0018CEF31F|nr:uncharacterized protein LOC119684835 [Teleopsis dalmanni]